MSEHPWMPKRPERASSWRTPLMGLVCGLPRIKLWCIHQVNWGAPAVKPTGILTCRGEHLGKSFSKWRLKERPKVEAAIGKDAQGMFNTSKLKEYPNEFSLALAQCVADFVSIRKHGSPVECESHLLAWINDAKKACEYFFREQWLPDYQH